MLPPAAAVLGAAAAVPPAVMPPAAAAAPLPAAAAAMIGASALLPAAAAAVPVDDDPLAAPADMPAVAARVAQAGLTAAPWPPTAARSGRAARAPPAAGLQERHFPFPKPARQNPPLESPAARCHTHLQPVSRLQRDPAPTQAARRLQPAAAARLGCRLGCYWLPRALPPLPDPLPLPPPPRHARAARRWPGSRLQTISGRQWANPWCSSPTERQRNQGATLAAGCKSHLITILSTELRQNWGCLGRRCLGAGSRRGENQGIEPFAPGTIAATASSSCSSGSAPAAALASAAELPLPARGPSE